MEITIIKVEGKFDLYHQYPGQFEPQPTFIELDPEGTVVSARYNAEIGNAVPMAVYHGRIRRYSLPVPLKADAANELMEELMPLFERVCDGFETVWNGNNTVGKLTDDAIAAEEEIEKITDAIDAESSGIAYWDVADYLQDADLDITAETTDEELEAKATEWEEYAEGEDVAINGDVLEYLTEKRDEMKDEEA